MNTYCASRRLSAAQIVYNGGVFWVVVACNASSSTSIVGTVIGVGLGPRGSGLQRRCQGRVARCCVLFCISTWRRYPAGVAFPAMIQSMTLRTRSSKRARCQCPCASEKRCTGIFGARTGHRSYNPDAGRWLNRDPIEERGGLNVYAMTGNNPVVRVDKDGRWYDSITSYLKNCGAMYPRGAKNYCECLCAPIDSDSAASDCVDRCTRCAGAIRALGKKTFNTKAMCICSCNAANARRKAAGKDELDCKKICGKLPTHTCI